jgi:hypothetical protein
MRPLVNKSCIFCVLLLFFCPAVTADGKVIYVDDDAPADFNNIQAAINDANERDTVIVGDGMYTGDGNRDIDFKGKTLTVRSANGPENCIIDCDGTETEPHRGFYFHSGEDANSVVWGLTITNGYGPDEELSGVPLSSGGAICCMDSAPTISNCIIRGNSTAMVGGGIFSWRSSPIVSNCIFSGNSAYVGGGACSSGGVISNCLFESNQAQKGSGVFCHSSDTVSIAVRTQGAVPTDGRIVPLSNNAGRFSQRIVNSTFFANTAVLEGGAIFCSGFTHPSVINCILWADSASHGSEIAMFAIGSRSSLSISYSDVQGGQAGIAVGSEPGCGLNWGPGNVDADPMFADPNNGDYHLKSQAGRWNPKTQSWIKDDVTSPCVDAGASMSPIGHEPFPNGGIINMGAYGGTAEASKSYFGKPICQTIIAGDINGDCKVDFSDFAIMTVHWLEER